MVLQVQDLTLHHKSKRNLEEFVDILSNSTEIAMLICEVNLETSDVDNCIQ